MTMLSSSSSAELAMAGGSRFDHWRFAGTVLRLGSPILIAIGIAAAIWLGLPLDARAKTALIVFALAIVGWCLASLDDTLIALAAAAALVLCGLASTRNLHAALGNELTWLLIGAFIIAAVLRASGLTERLASAVLSRTRSVRALFLAATGVIVATALFVPSTSGRAALLLPVYLALAAGIDDRRIRRALALLFPTVILLSAGGTLIGAGAHLIAIEMIQRSGGAGHGYLGWLLLGMPLAVLASFGATFIILFAFLRPAERAHVIELPSTSAESLSGRQLYVGALVILVVIGWCTQPVHGVDAALVTLCGAIALTLKPLAPLSMKQAVKSVEWQLILFLAATTLMGQTLIETGAANGLLRPLLGALPQDALANPMMVAALVSTVALLSHLLITSRSARATVLIPLLAPPLAALSYDFGALAMLIVMGTGFCQSLPVSAKPVALYADLEHETYRPRDLIGLSLLLLPMMGVLLMVFSLWIWPLFGLSLR
ncbi:SLC13 family permease [Bosea sp. NPDC003192]|uniref:SLC13 family permease n=1 Tax=Bosea sp. NPDC003192 TaxID=3390551 RepID=UPI003D01552C